METDCFKEVSRCTPGAMTGKPHCQCAFPSGPCERDKPAAPRPGVFDLRRQLGRAPTVAEFRAARGLH